MTEDRTLHFAIHGIRVAVDSVDRAFLTYCARFLAYFRLDERSKVPDLSVRITTKSVSLAGKPSVEKLWGSDVAQHTGALVIRAHAGAGLYCEIAEEEESGKQRVYCYPQVSWLKRLARHVAGRREATLQLYMTIIRQAILLPVMALLSVERGWLALHGSVVTRDENALLLTGMNGCGKSSLAWHLVQQHDFRFMSDNFALIDPEDLAVYCLPEVLRTNVQAMTDPEGQPMVCIGRAFGKYQYIPPKALIATRAQVHKLVSVAIAPAFTLCGVAPGPFAAESEAMHRYLAETPEYAWLQLYYQLQREISLGEIATKGREDLCRKVDCYEMHIPRASDNHTRYGKVVEALDAQLAVAGASEKIAT